MLFPTTFTIIASFLLKLCSSSPIFNTLPGRPTLNNAGPVGRNIRNLPCVSRKSSEKGVCMFAIDCQKANGTHLGTCIDRFYFGSCCLIEPIHDIGNSIDTAIIPSRQPPSRLSSTTTSQSSRVTEKTTVNISPSTKIQETLSPKPYVPTIIIGSTITRPTQYYFGDKLTTLKFATTPILPTATSPTLSSIFLDSTNKVAPHRTTNLNPQEISYKLTTFQTVDENTVTNEPLTTQQIKSNSTRTRPTLKPKPTTTSYTKIASTTTSTKNPTTLTTTLKQKPFTRKTTTKTRLTTTVKPLKISKPTKTTTLATKKTDTTLAKFTKKPTISISTSTNRYVTEKPTLPSSTTLKTPLSSTIKTAQPTTLAFKVTSPTLTTIDKISTLLNLFNLTSTTLRSSSSTSTPILTTKRTFMTTLETESGNIGTNEIEQPKPLSPPPTTEEPNNSSFVTWEVVDDDKTTTTNKPTTDDWMPVTTADSWVLLPSVTSTLNPNNSTTNLILNNTTRQSETTTTTQFEKPTEISSSSTSTAAPFDYSAENNLTFNNNTTSTINTATSSQFSSTITNLIETSSMAPLGVNMTDYTDVCGRRLYPEARIVGGERATFGKWPWQISLRQWRTSTYLHKCGAALLNENWAITAAHCVDNVPPSDLLLRLGEHDLSTDSEPYIHQERRVQIVASHPQFDPRTFEYDLALLRFYEPVQFQPNIIPVCVPNNDENFVGRTAHVTGWGRLYEDGPLPSVLQEVSVPVINNTVCESMYRSAGYIEHIPHIFICAGWRRGGFDSCEGDSGGPMVIQRPDKRFLLAGVISWGIGCAEPNQPGVYTRISEFKDWINQILQF